MPPSVAALRPLLAVALAALLASVPGTAGRAFAQRIAQQFDQQAAGATEGPTAAPGAPTGRPTTNLVPHIPRAVSRPESWPGAKRGPAGDNHVLSSIRARPGDPIEPIEPDADEADDADGPVLPASWAEPASADAEEGEPLDGATVMARVGPEVVLEADLLTPTALEWLAKVTPGMKPEQVRELRRQICRQVLPQHVDSLLVYVDACRTIPEERLPEIEKKVNEAFDAQQLPQMVKQSGCGSAAEYEALLRARGQSLERVRKMFFERALAQQWMQQRVDIDTEIPHADMIAYYQGHLADYDFSAKARFEQLTVKVGKRSRQEAWNLLAAMGNDVLEGRSFADVARERSEGPTAASGGAFDWTTQGSLVSKVVDEAIFTLPVGELSAILEEPAGLHIVRVVERVDAGRVPFIDAQTGIREQLAEERRKRELDDYLAKLRQRTPVWTTFEEGAEGVRQTAAAAPAGGAAKAPSARGR
ncbi:MAG: peptidylprolyl isomerase [Planctomycetaceae bacterium]